MRSAVVPLLLVAACSSNSEHVETSHIACDTEVSFPIARWPVVGNGAVGLAAADLDGDGHVDLVSSNINDHTISVLRGRGDASFADRHDYATGRYPGWVTIVDLDHDGHADILTANTMSNTVSVLRGIGDGTFEPAISYPTDEVPQYLATADIDDDSRLDVVVTGGRGTVWGLSVLLQQPDGSLATSAFYPATRFVSRFAIADLDGDHHLDIVATTGEITHSTVDIFRGNGSGTFGAPVPLDVGAGTNLIALPDLSGDGVPDLVVSNTGRNTVTVATGVGDGTFRDYADHTLNTFSNGPAGTLLVTDATGDGKLDLVMSSGPDTLTVLAGNGQGAVSPTTDATLGVFASSASIAADLDHDGHTDLVFASGIDVLDVVRGGPGGAFPSVRTFATAGFGGQNAAAVGDFDGDAAPDLVQTNDDGTATFSHGQGDGTFAAPVLLVAGGPATAAVSVDIDNDGNRDVIVAGDGRVRTLRGDGGGGFTVLASALDSAQSYAPAALVLADLDNDRRLDVITNQGSVLLGRGDGTFDDAVAYGPGAPAWSDVADLDGDGVPDLVITDAGGGVLWIAHGIGDGTFAAPLTMPVGGTPNGVAASDLNGDGLPELVVSIPEAHAIGVFGNLGGGMFGPRVDAPAGSPYRIIKAQLTSANDRPSFVVLDVASGSISAYLGDGHGGLHPRSIYGAGLAVRDVTIADLDGNHLPDLTIAGSLHGIVLLGDCVP